MLSNLRPHASRVPTILLTQQMRHLAPRTTICQCTPVIGANHNKLSQSLLNSMPVDAPNFSFFCDANAQDVTIVVEFHLRFREWLSASNGIISVSLNRNMTVHNGAEQREPARKHCAPAHLIYRRLARSPDDRIGRLRIALGAHQYCAPTRLDWMHSPTIWRKAQVPISTIYLKAIKSLTGYT
jgi:hypothetical protein